MTMKKIMTESRAQRGMKILKRKIIYDFVLRL